jgi:hypothetical protein
MFEDSGNSVVDAYQEAEARRERMEREQERFSHDCEESDRARDDE